MADQPTDVTPERVLAASTAAGFTLDHLTDPDSGEHLVAGMVDGYPANILVWQDWLLVRLDHPTGGHGQPEASRMLLAANRCNNSAQRSRTLIIDTADQYVVRTDCSVDIGRGLTDMQLKAVVRQSLTLAVGAMERFRVICASMTTGS